jgi:hypothetical protein
LPETVALDDFTTVTGAAVVVELLLVKLAELVEPQAAINNEMMDNAATDGSERFAML